MTAHCPHVSHPTHPISNRVISTTSRVLHKQRGGLYFGNKFPQQAEHPTYNKRGGGGGTQQDVCDQGIAVPDKTHSLPCFGKRFASPLLPGRGIIREAKREERAFTVISEIAMTFGQLKDEPKHFSQALIEN